MQLQLEIEEIDTDHISNLPQERIKHYNRVLAEQVLRKCNRVLNELEAELFDIEKEAAFLQETPKNIKIWLRAQRDRSDELLDAGLLDDLFR